MEDLYYYKELFLHELEIPIQNRKDLILHPVYMKDYNDLMFALGIMQIEKEQFANTQNVVENMQIIQMSNLEYAINLMNKTDVNGEKTEEARIKTMQFEIVFLLCLHIPIKRLAYSLDENGKVQILINDTIVISSKEYDLIKKLVCFQHLINFDDEYVSPDMRKEMEERRKLDTSRYEMPTLEQRISAYCCNFKCGKKDVLSLTVREFTVNEEMYSSIEEYKSLRSAELGGMVKFEKPIEHYLYRLKKEKTDGFLIPFEQFKDKMGQSGGVSFQ